MISARELRMRLDSPRTSSLASTGQRTQMTFAHTKIQPPRPRSAFVERAELQSRLTNALLHRRLVLLCAPAGYGKTALLAQQVARLPQGTATAWISADAGDDLQRLLECMLAALEPFDPPWRTAPEALVVRAGRASSDEQRDVAAEIINTLDACGAPHGVIVLDDVHRVGDPDFFRFMDLLIGRMSSRWTVAITSRSDPPLALARWRAADELAEFRQLQLQFARDEARSLAAATGVDRGVADRLFDRTQGWPAGMRIAFGALQGGAGADGAVERALRASERPLFEFLLTEVLEQVPSDLRDFLLAVSVLPELDADRCAAVSERADAAALLDAIERLGLFVDVLDAPVHTLRLHDLFRDALQQQLQRQDPARLGEVRRRAAATETDPIRRIALLLEAGAVDEAAGLAADHLPRLIVTAGAGSALHMVSRFPPAMRDRSAELAFVRALACWAQYWDFPGMLALLERAVRDFAERGDTRRQHLAMAYRTIALIGLGRFDEAGRDIDFLLRQDLPPEAQAIVLNAEAWLAIDACRYAEVAPVMSRLLDLLQRMDRIDLWFQTTPPLRMPGLPGITPVLERHAALMLRVAGDEPTALRSIAVQTQAWCALWRGRIDDAQRLVDSARDDAHWSGQTRAVRAHQLTFGAVHGVIVGDVPGAIAAADTRLQTFSPTGSPWQRYTLCVTGARTAASGNDLAALRTGLARIEAAAPADPTLRRPRELPLHAQLAWLEGRVDDALTGWTEALAIEDRIDLMGLAVEVRVRLASALVQRGDLAAAARRLGPVFERARLDGPGGALLAGEALGVVATAKWCHALPEAGAAALREWWHIVQAARESRRVVSAAPDGSAARGTDDGIRRAAAPASGLTARELEVLARIAAGDSNKLIARAFDLSLHTVKRHVANILDKLAVDTRGQAAAWYRAHAG
jgi:LuxR family maltose regulon positive regulatory protein